jgi:twitching motility protein PilT
MNSSIQTGTKHGMQLLDDALFKLWQEETCEKTDVLSKAHDAAELTQRIANAERGIFEDEEEIAD